MILVTGGTGRVGNALVRELVKRKEKIRVLVRSKKDIESIKDFQDQIELIEGDITNNQTVNKACKGVQKVYHLAAIVNIMANKKELMEEVNVKGTENVINACLKNKVKRLVYMSTIHAINEPEAKEINEQCGFIKSKAISNYDKTKAQASIKVLKAVKNKGLKAVIVSPTGVLGPFDYQKTFLSQYFINYVKNKQWFCIKGAYDFVDVRDVVDGTIKAMEKGRVGENYLLSGNKVTIGEVNNILNDYLKKEKRIVKTPYWLAIILVRLWEQLYMLLKKKTIYTPYSLITLQRNCEISHEKATKELGYHPRPINETIKDQLNWFKEQEMI